MITENGHTEQSTPESITADNVLRDALYDKLCKDYEQQSVWRYVGWSSEAGAWQWPWQQKKVSDWLPFEKPGVKKEELEKKEADIFKIIEEHDDQSPLVRTLERWFYGRGNERALLYYCHIKKQTQLPFQPSDKVKPYLSTEEWAALDKDVVYWQKNVTNTEKYVQGNTFKKLSEEACIQEYTALWRWTWRAILDACQDSSLSLEACQAQVARLAKKQEEGTDLLRDRLLNPNSLGEYSSEIGVIDQWNQATLKTLQEDFKNQRSIFSGYAQTNPEWVENAIKLPVKHFVNKVKCAEYEDKSILRYVGGWWPWSKKKASVWVDSVNKEGLNELKKKIVDHDNSFLLVRLYNYVFKGMGTERDFLYHLQVKEATNKTLETSLPVKQYAPTEPWASKLDRNSPWQGLEASVDEVVIHLKPKSLLFIPPENFVREHNQVWRWTWQAILTTCQDTSLSSEACQAQVEWLNNKHKEALRLLNYRLDTPLPSTFQEKVDAVTTWNQTTLQTLLKDFQNQRDIFSDNAKNTPQWAENAIQYPLRQYAYKKAYQVYENKKIWRYVGWFSEEGTWQWWPWRQKKVSEWVALVNEDKLKDTIATREQSWFSGWQGLEAERDLLYYLQIKNEADKRLDSSLSIKGYLSDVPQTSQLDPKSPWLNTQSSVDALLTLYHPKAFSSVTSFLKAYTQLWKETLNEVKLIVEAQGAYTQEKIKSIELQHEEKAKALLKRYPGKLSLEYQTVIQRIDKDSTSALQQIKQSIGERKIALIETSPMIEKEINEVSSSNPFAKQWQQDLMSLKFLLTELKSTFHKSKGTQKDTSLLDAEERLQVRFRELAKCYHPDCYLQESEKQAAQEIFNQLGTWITNSINQLKIELEQNKENQQENKQTPDERETWLNQLEQQIMNSLFDGVKVLNRKMDEIDKKFDTKLDEIDKKLNEKVNNLDMELVELNDKIAKISQKLHKLDPLDPDADELKRRFDNAQQQVKIIQQTIDTLKKESKKNTQNEDNEIGKKVDIKTVTEKQKLELKITEFSKNKETSLQNLKKEVRELKKEMGELKSEVKEDDMNSFKEFGQRKMIISQLEMKNLESENLEKDKKIEQLELQSGSFRETSSVLSGHVNRGGHPIYQPKQDILESKISSVPKKKQNNTNEIPSSLEEEIQFKMEK